MRRNTLQVYLLSKKKLLRLYKANQYSELLYFA